MSLGALYLQEYTSGVYQTGTPSSEHKIRLIQPYLEFSYSPFVSSELLNLEVPPLPRGTPSNKHIRYYLHTFIFVLDI